MKDAGEILETELQPGAGSWDYLFGVSTSMGMGRTRLHGNILYNLTTEGGQDIEIGDALFYNLGTTWTLLNAEHHTDHSHNHPHL